MASDSRQHTHAHINDTTDSAAETSATSLSETPGDFTLAVSSQGSAATCRGGLCMR